MKTRKYNDKEAGKLEVSTGPTSILAIISGRLGWLDLLAFIARESKLSGAEETTIRSNVSVPQAFLKLQHKDLEAEVDPEFVDVLRNALEAKNLARFALSSAAAADPSYRSRLAGLVRGFDALSLVSFEPTLKLCLRNAKSTQGLSYQQVADKMNIHRNKLAGWLAQVSGGISNMTPAEALQLDDIGAAHGELFAAYVALSQDTPRPAAPAMPQILGRDTFATLLQRNRANRGWTMADVAVKLLANTRVTVDHTRLYRWEQGHGAPAQSMRVVVEALDLIFAANGQILAAWEAGVPARDYSAYALRRSGWPPQLQQQFITLVEYMTTNPNDWPKSTAPGAGQWSGTATEAKVQELFERFFGYLTSEQGFAVTSLSLTLTAEWSLVQGYLDFVRTRTGREDYSIDAAVSVRILLALIRWFLPHLAATVAEESYWDARLPVSAQEKMVLARGLTHDFEIPLVTSEERWQRQLFEVEKQAQTFLHKAPIRKGGALGKSAEPLHAVPDAIGQLALHVAELAAELPLRILTPDAALYLRQLTEVVLILSCCFRPETLLTLRDNQVILPSDRSVQLKLPEDQFKTKGRGGSQLGINGELPNYSFILDTVRRWKLEGRPVLVQKGLRLGMKDEGYFLTPRYVACQDRTSSRTIGGPICHETLRRDVRTVLGYAPYAQRHLFGTEAWLKGIGHEETAKVLMNTANMVEMFYAQKTALLRGLLTQAVCQRVLFGQWGK